MGLDGERDGSTRILGPGDSWIDRSTTGCQLEALMVCQGDMPYPEDLGLAPPHT